MTIQLVDYSFFTGHYKMIAIDLSKLQLLHAGIEETDFTGNLDRDATIFFHYWRGKRYYYGYFKLWDYCKSILL